MAGTTTLLFGMNVFATPVQASVGENTLSDSAPVTGKGTADTQKEETANQDGVATSSTGKNVQNGQADDAALIENDKNNPTQSSQNTKKLEKVDVKEKFYNQDGSINKTELVNHLNEVEEKDPLGVAGVFHIFADQVIQNVDIAGNIATNELKGENFGTNTGATSNLTTGDVHYIGKLDQLNQINGDNSIVVFGPDIEYRSFENGGSTQVKFDNNDWQKVDIPYNRIVKSDQKLDIQSELKKLGDKSDNWARQAQTKGVETNFTDINNSWIDVSNVNRNDDKSPIYVSIDASALSQKHNIEIKGIPAGVNDPIIILNVTNAQNGSLTVQTHLTLDYDNGSKVTGASETQNQYNKLLWNFGTNVEHLTIGGDYHLGSILAPNAEIDNNVNVDGNIIGKKVTIKGETHRWDLITPSFVGFEPDPKLDPNPQPEPKLDPNPDPNPEPKPESNPEPKSNTSKQPETPDFSEPKSKTPLPDAMTATVSNASDVETFFKAQAKKAFTPNKKHVSISTAAVYKPTAPKTKVEQVKVTKLVAPKEDKVVAPKVATLPQTGEKQNNAALLGLAIGVMALAIGFIDKAKKY